MVSEEQIDLIVERLVSRIDKANTYFLRKIGESIKTIRELSPSDAQQLVQILKYGGSYEDIVREIQRYTNMNINEIDAIFNAYAQKDASFSRQFFKYRQISFPTQNVALEAQKKAIAQVVKNDLYNFTRENVLGYSLRDIDGNVRFTGLRETYNRVLDEALLNVSQGKESFDSAMSHIMEDIGGSGLKTIDYSSGRSIRLDSIARMHLKDGLRNLHNANQEILGEQFQFDGWEISVHSNPAVDHMQVQGRQFSREQYELLQTTGTATDTAGKVINMHRENKDGEESDFFRPISDYNCYHVAFSIVLGVSKPRYDEEALQKIIDERKQEFEFEGKKYNKYEGTQLQRKIERAIREQKDIQILAKEGNNKELIDKSQEKISQLTNKYYKLSKIGNLPTRLERLKVNGYRKVAKSKLK